MSVAVVGYSASELAGLPGLPRDARTVRLRAERERWACVAVTRRGGEARLYSLASLPLEAQEALARRTVMQIPTPVAPEADEIGAPAAHVARAVECARLARAVAELITRGVPLLRACETVAAETSHSARSIRRWHDAVRKLPATEWVSRLIPQWKPTGTRMADCHPDAWTYLRDDYLRQSKPALRACYRRMCTVAATHGWSPVPSYHAARRRLEREVSTAERVLRRQGEEALSRLYPAQERDRSVFRPMQAINGDGHVADVMVRWPDGKVKRPTVIGLQDLASSKILAVRVDRSENAEVIRLAVADMIRDHGVPEHAYFDNGRTWASKEMTGRQLTRYRGRIRQEDPSGLLTSLGIEVHFTRPYHGQSKPIERAWRDLVEEVARHPAFERAYVGSDPTQRPENYDEDRAVPLELFLQVLMTHVRESNARPGRVGHDGQSFDAVFAAGLAEGQVKRVAEWQRRLLYLAVDKIKARSLQGEIHMWGARYWAQAMIERRGEMVTVRFDPQDLASGLYVYALDGTYICHATPIDKVPFNSRGAARERANALGAMKKATKNLAAAQQRFTPRELAAAHLAAAGAPAAKAAAKIVAPVFGMARPELDERVIVAPTAKELERVEASNNVVLELGKVSRTQLADERVDDDLMAEISRVSFAKLADQRR